MSDYNYLQIEKKWQAYWDQNKTFKVDKPGKKKCYVLDMFPYPSGSGLHLGHPVGYTQSDIYARYMRMKGYSVLHPMGFDAFGLPAEQHAISTGEHPSIITKQSCEKFKTQMKGLGLSFDWDRELATCDAEYYRWTQWIFLKIFNSWFDEKQNKARPIEELPIPAEVKKAGAKAIEDYRAKYRLAYYSDAMVNWCPGLGTVLANEEVIDGKSERGGFDVVRKPMKQWMLRITKYSDRLLSELDDINWPESIKEQQRNWIGRKTGVELHFAVPGHAEKIAAFTTRVDTLFGVTFIVLSPEHPLVNVVTTKDAAKRVRDYCDEAQKMSEFTRTLDNRKKTGVFTGGFAINPINNEQIPIYVGDYVLMSYGTGAVMGVPAHDERDFDFARTFQLEIRPVIAPQEQDEETTRAILEGEVAWTKPGLMIDLNSPMMHELKLAGVANDKAADVIASWLESKKLGTRIVNYKLRDWLFSRQRYWGEPIPLVHWEDGRITGLDDSELPLILPEVKDYKPSSDGESPLSKAENWLYVTDPKTGMKGRRETNTMPQWAGSCWYYLRFADPHNSKLPWSSDIEKGWMPVDMYVGGAEHAVLHLLYSRFWHKVLFDLGYVSTREPFQRLFNQGMLLGYAYKDKRGALIPIDEVVETEDGKNIHQKTGEALERIVAKMSKSLRNVVNPEDVIQQYGTDTLRMYIMFMGPPDCNRIYDPKAIVGVHRFLKRAFTFVSDSLASKDRIVEVGKEDNKVVRAINLLVKRVGEDIERWDLNTCASSMMEFLNTVSSEKVSKQTLEKFALVMSPYAPHIAEELWQALGHQKTLAHEPWPEYDPEVLKQNVASVVVQVNGKKRALVEISVEASEDKVKQAVIDCLANTDYKVAASDRFITVFQPGTSVPRLVNVLKQG